MAGIATGHPATTRVGADILAAGGSAADVAVAAVLTSCVAETILTGLGGAGFATYLEAASGLVTCLDFFAAVPGRDGDAPAGPMRPVEITFGDVPLPYESGGASVGVPGVPAGCGELHRRWGRLPWRELVAPAIRLARTGVPLSEAHAAALPAVAPALTHGPGADAYAPGGRLLGPGDTLHHPGLAAVLQLLADEGPAAFYTGALATPLVEAVRADGGALGRADLARYTVRELPVVSARFAGRRVSGRDDLNGTLAAVAGLAAAVGLARPQRSVALATVLKGPLAGWGETTNVSVIDADGDACVVTTTLGIGSGVWLPGLGVHLNSMLGEGELRAGTDPAPGARVASMMCPLVVRGADGVVELAVGSAGASRIRTALLGTLFAVLVDGVDVAAAVARPRFHVVDDVVHAEPGVPDEELAALAAAGYLVRRWDQLSYYFGGVSAVGMAGAAGDPRRGGTGLPA